MKLCYPDVCQYICEGYGCSSLQNSLPGIIMIMMEDGRACECLFKFTSLQQPLLGQADETTSLLNHAAKLYAIVLSLLTTENCQCHLVVDLVLRRLTSTWFSLLGLPAGQTGLKSVSGTATSSLLLAFLVDLEMSPTDVLPPDTVTGSLTCSSISSRSKEIEPCKHWPSV